MKGKLVSFEGIDNCGKTTQIKLLEDYLKEHGIDAVACRDPGQTLLGEVLRHVLKQPEQVYSVLGEKYKFLDVDVEQERTKQAETLLYMAARAEYVEHIIKKNIEKGVSVLSDRLGDSTRAYQGGGNYNGNKIAINLINRLNKFVMDGYMPEKTFFLDIPYNIMIERANGGELDYMESRGEAYFKRINDEYRNIAREEPRRIVWIDGTKHVDEIFTVHIMPEARKIWKNI